MAECNKGSFEAESPGQGFAEFLLSSTRKEHHKSSGINEEDLGLYRHLLQNPEYMQDAIETIAGNLSLEIMEDTYGISFKS